MDYYTNIPSAPLKSSREHNLRKIIYDAIAYGNVDCYCDEEAIISEFINTYNWRPLSSEIDALVNKYSFGKKNICIVCGSDMGIENPRQMCRKTYCGNVV